MSLLFVIYPVVADSSKFWACYSIHRCYSYLPKEIFVSPKNENWPCHLESLWLKKISAVILPILMKPELISNSLYITNISVISQSSQVYLSGEGKKTFFCKFQNQNYSNPALICGSAVAASQN